MPTVLASQPSRRTSGRPRGADSVLRREEILGIAAQVFSEEGFRSVSMSALARACDMSLTGLVHYFPTKDLLLQAVMDRRDELDDARVAGPGQARAPDRRRTAARSALPACAVGLISAFKVLACES